MAYACNRLSFKKYIYNENSRKSCFYKHSVTDFTSTCLHFDSNLESLVSNGLNALPVDSNEPILTYSRVGSVLYGSKFAKFTDIIQVRKINEMGQREEKNSEWIFCFPFCCILS